VIKIAVKKTIYVNDTQNVAFPASQFVIELLPVDYLSIQKQRVNKKGGGCTHAVLVIGLYELLGNPAT
jgi:hypothetical protein